MRLSILLTCSVMLFAFQSLVYGEDLHTGVKYVSASSIYLDKGREAGIQVGDKVTILRGSEIIATLEVLHLASSSASCKIISASGEIHVGDAAVVEITPQPVTPEVQIERADTLTIPQDTSRKDIVAKRSGIGIVERLKGRASIQVYHQEEAGGNSYTEPSLYLQTEAVNIAKTGINLNVRFRVRQRQLSEGGKEWNNRIYEASLRKAPSESKLIWGLGRLTINRAPGIGYIDGGMFEYTLNRKFLLGGFAGAEPVWGGGDPQWDRVKGGGYVNYQIGDYSTNRRLSTTAALVGSYRNGQPAREFLYLDNDLSLVRNISFYQSCEVEINRDWRKEVEGATLKISSFMLTGRWTVYPGVQINFGYDDRTPYRDYESRSTPDSLFDDALRRGFRAGISSRMPLNGRITLDGNAGATRGQATSRSSSFTYYQPNLIGSGIDASGRFNLFSSAFSEGWQPSFSLNRNVTRHTSVVLQGGVNSYRIKNSNRSESTSRWGRMGVDYSFGRKFYGSASYEIQNSNSLETKRINLDLGARL